MDNMENLNALLSMDDMEEKSDKTRRGLLPGFIAIIVCIAMLAGTTLAWFTDTASTGLNVVESGGLEVDIEKPSNYDGWTSAEGKTLLFKESNAVGSLTGSNSILWEPGATFKAEEFRIVNNSTLALQYSMTISGFEGDMELLDAIDFYVKVWMCGEFDSKLPWAEGTGMKEPHHDHEDEGCELIATIPISEIADYEDIILPGDPKISKKYDMREDVTSYVQIGASYTFAIEGHMKETAGNEYQKKRLEGLAVKVLAKQAEHEYDSYGKTYDKAASYAEKVAAGKSFTSGTHTLSTGVIVTNANAVALNVSGDGTNVTITNGTFDGGSGGNNKCVKVSGNATVTIKGGTFTVGGDANGYGNAVIESWGGNIVIEGGFFSTDYSYGGKYYVLNQKNDNPGTITVRGGTFVNYNPSNGDDNRGGSFVAAGYHVEKAKQANGDIWYTVVAGA